MTKSPNYICVSSSRSFRFLLLSTCDFVEYILFDFRVFEQKRLWKNRPRGGMIHLSVYDWLGLGVNGADQITSTQI